MSVAAGREGATALISDPSATVQPSLQVRPAASPVVPLNGPRTPARKRVFFYLLPVSRKIRLDQSPETAGGDQILAAIQSRIACSEGTPDQTSRGMPKHESSFTNVDALRRETHRDPAVAYPILSSILESLLPTNL